MITKVLDFGSKKGAMSTWDDKDFLWEFMYDCLFDGEYVQCNGWDKVLGYCHLGEYDDAVTELLLEETTMYVYFYGYNFITQEMMDELIKKINEFCKDKDGLSVKLHMDKGDRENYKPIMYLTFFERA